MMKAPAATACMRQQIGFKAAAPCMIKYMKTFRTAADTQLAAQTVALEDQVRAGRISNRDAYTRYVAIRNEIKSAVVRANIGAALGAFATGFAAGMPRTTTCNRIGATVQCQTW
jgi:hypothetical protein